MNDRELLEAAAKAARIELGPWQERQSSFYKIGDPFKPANWWNPLTDDGDALRLAVVLGLELDFEHDPICAGIAMFGVREPWGTSPSAAARRAIVRAAAAMAAD